MQPCLGFLSYCVEQSCRCSFSSVLFQVCFPAEGLRVITWWEKEESFINGKTTEKYKHLLKLWIINFSLCIFNVFLYGLRSIYTVYLCLHLLMETKRRYDGVPENIFRSVFKSVFTLIQDQTDAEKWCVWWTAPRVFMFTCRHGQSDVVLFTKPSRKDGVRGRVVTKPVGAAGRRSCVNADHQVTVQENLDKRKKQVTPGTPDGCYLYKTGWGWIYFIFTRRFQRLE